MEERPVELSLLASRGASDWDLRATLDPAQPPHRTPGSHIATTGSQDPARCCMTMTPRISHGHLSISGSHTATSGSQDLTRPPRDLGISHGYLQLLILVPQTMPRAHSPPWYRPPASSVNLTRQVSTPPNIGLDQPSCSDREPVRECPLQSTTEGARHRPSVWVVLLVRVLGPNCRHEGASVGGVRHACRSECVWGIRHT